MDSFTLVECAACGKTLEAQLPYGLGTVRCSCGQEMTKPKYIANATEFGWKCSNCQTVLKVPNRHAGKKCKCTHCKETLVLPICTPGICAKCKNIVGFERGEIAATARKCNQCKREVEVPSAITLDCPTCHHKTEVTSNLSGRNVKCKGCKSLLEVPEFLRIQCPNCKCDLRATEDALQKKPGCPKCNIRVTAPEPEDGEAGAEETEAETGGLFAWVKNMVKPKPSAPPQPTPYDDILKTLHRLPIFGIEPKTVGGSIYIDFPGTCHPSSGGGVQTARIQVYKAEELAREIHALRQLGPSASPIYKSRMVKKWDHSSTSENILVIEVEIEYGLESMRNACTFMIEHIRAVRIDDDAFKPYIYVTMKTKDYGHYARPFNFDRYTKEQKPADNSVFSLGKKLDLKPFTKL